MVTTRQKIAAAVAAEKSGQPCPEWARLGAGVAPAPVEKSHKYNLNNLNNLNLVSSKKNNLNNLNPREGKNKSGLKRRELLADKALKRLLEWGVEEWLIFLCVKSYGIHAVKGEANRIQSIPDSYFKQAYGNIESQKGRFFNRAMQELKARGEAV